jgi:NADH:ubiquinone reductase (H+-translocating)
MSQPTRILILGGGFGGVYAALTLEKALKAEIGRGEVELGLVSRENYIVFQPMLPEVISGSIGVLDVITPIRRLCPRTNLYTRTIESIDLTNRSVQSAAGFGSRQHHLHFDHLVVALGNVTSFAGSPGLAEYALPFKYLGDALTVRNRLIHTLEEADIEQDREARRSLLTFVVAGGGFSGVEAVAELNDFVRAAARSFRNVRPEEIRVVLLHAGGLILPELPRSLAEFAQALLMKRGVEIRLNTRLSGATVDLALLEGGDRIATRTLVSTVPSAPNQLVAMLPVKKERGRILVDANLEVPEFPGLWAVGDCAAIRDARTGDFCPPTAQHATREATCAARNIVAALKGTPKRAFMFTALGKMGALGRRSAVAEIFGIKLSGFLAWWLWRTIYLMKLPGLDRKIRVATDWTLDLILPARHRAAQDRPRARRAPRVLRAGPGDLPRGRPRRLALRRHRGRGRGPQDRPRRRRAVGAPARRGRVLRRDRARERPGALGHRARGVGHQRAGHRSRCLPGDVLDVAPAEGLRRAADRLPERVTR